MVLVILACINPWVRNSAITLKMKVLRFIKLLDKMGWVAFRSVRINPVKQAKDAISMIRNGVDIHPKFCPNEGTHNNKLKKIRIKTAPDKSKFCNIFLVDVWFREVRVHAIKMPLQKATHTHSMARHP